MGLDSKLELYTTLYGWLFYNSIWEVLVATGIVFLPFIGIVVDTVISTYSNEDAEQAGNTSLRVLEVEFFVAFFVLFMAGVPTIPLSASELSFTPKAVIGSPAQIASTPDNSQSTYGGTISFVNYPNAVDLPVFWYVVLSFNAGFNRAVMEDIPPSLDLRAYTDDLRDLRIEDPLIQAEINDFYRDCFVEARSKYLDERPQSAAINLLLDSYGITDPEWIGSHVFLDVAGYYPSLRSETIREGFPYSQLRDVEWTTDNHPIYGKPFCNEWWSDPSIGLARKILDGTDDIELVAAAVEPTWNPVLRRDAIIKAVLLNSPARWTNRGYDLAYGNMVHLSYEQDKFYWEPLANFGQQVIAGAGLTYESFFFAGYLRVFLEAAPMFQALILMGLYALLPFYVLISRYRFSVFIGGALVFFIVKFWTLLWFISWWVDQNLILAFYSDLGSLTNLYNIDMTMKRVILNFLTGMMYVVFPVLFSVYLGMAGIHAGRGVDSASSMIMRNLSNVGRNMKPKIPKFKDKK